MACKVNWVTPNGDELVTYMAKVSNPKREFESSPKLLRYLLDHNHWSPFEMVNACVEIETTRDISRQVLRHRSFSFQEFSQRYAEVNEVRSCVREFRLQDKTNRQNSIEVLDDELQKEWEAAQQAVATHAEKVYREFLDRGIAKEQARVVLPEGLTPTTMHMNGTLRSWIHYWQVRCTPETQKEHRLLAEETRKMILPHFPIIREALNNDQAG